MEPVMFAVKPSMRQFQSFLYGTGHIVADVLSLAFDMAEIAIRQIQPLGEQLEHAALRKMRVLIDEFREEFLEVLVSYLCAIHRHVALSLLTGIPVVQLKMSGWRRRPRPASSQHAPSGCMGTTVYLRRGFFW
jgi:hypothetical protein